MSFCPFFTIIIHICTYKVTTKTTTKFIILEVSKIKKKIKKKFTQYLEERDREICVCVCYNIRKPVSWFHVFQKKTKHFIFLITIISCKFIYKLSIRSRSAVSIFSTQFVFSHSHSTLRRLLMLSYGSIQTLPKHTQLFVTW